MYLTVGIASLVLTAVAFYAVLTTTALHAYAVPVIVVLAIVQVLLQTFLFMHLREGRAVYRLFFGYGAFLAVVIAWSIGYVLTSYNPVAKAKPLTKSQLIAMGGKIVTTECISCHVVNGTGGHIGPNLNAALAGKVNLVPGGKPTDPAWVATWISDPQAVWPKALMPNLGLTPQQVKGVVAYLETKVK